MLGLETVVHQGGAPQRNALLALSALTLCVQSDGDVCCRVLIKFRAAGVGGLLQRAVGGSWPSGDRNLPPPPEGVKGFCFWDPRCGGRQVTGGKAFRLWLDCSERCCCRKFKPQVSGAAVLALSAAARLTMKVFLFVLLFAILSDCPYSLCTKFLNGSTAHAVGPQSITSKPRLSSLSIPQSAFLSTYSSALSLLRSTFSLNKPILPSFLRALPSRARLAAEHSGLRG